MNPSPVAGPDLSIAHLLAGSSAFAMAILAILGVFSVMSWGSIAVKWVTVQRVKRAHKSL